VKTEKNELGQKPENFVNEPASLENLNLLIVEDDDVSSELIEAMIIDTFRKITFAGNGIEAIEICRNNPEINLVLMDIKMSRMSGYTATREIRKFNKEIIIIAQTAYGLSGDREKAIDAGCNDYIAKPINKNDLFKMIERNFG
jgi:CheY-like chemotaxis protein